MDNPTCQDKIVATGKPCRHPVKFVWRSGENQKLVCGIHARQYTASSLTPFRMKDWLANKWGVK